MFSIIIPAHNEERLIVPTLVSLLEDQQLTHCRICIVCNGCTDNTVAVANSFIKDQLKSLKNRLIEFDIIETNKPSKTHAMNMGIAESKTEQVILIDADISISGEDILNLFEYLNANQLLAAAPKVKFQYQKSSFLVRSYYHLSSQSFYNQYHRLSNVIALSQEGLKRIDKIPGIIADDEYIRRQFKSDEYKILNTISFDFVCPKTLKDLLQVLTRVERGNLQLAKLNYLDNTHANLSGFIHKPLLSFPIFLCCKFFAKIRAKWQFANGNVSQWERDESNR